MPRNPFINAGAIAICDILVSRLGDPKAEQLAVIRKLSGIATVKCRTGIADSEN
ncbi:glutaminase [Marinagarivorans cellulosilyticus]|uniref:glutaminase n=1 Tax=Marinagarivorans cellulosilyticus TaxID=2721545 RepID=UPI003B82D851